MNVKTGKVRREDLDCLEFFSFRITFEISMYKPPKLFQTVRNSENSVLLRESLYRFLTLSFQVLHYRIAAFRSFSSLSDITLLSSQHCSLGL